MFILGQFFASLALLFSLVFKLLYFLLVVRIFLSWFPVDPFNEIVRTIYGITDPILRPLQRIPLQVGAIDFTPVLAFIAIYFLDNFVVGVLRHLAFQFGS